MLILLRASSIGLKMVQWRQNTSTVDANKVLICLYVHSTQQR